MHDLSIAKYWASQRTFLRLVGCGIKNKCTIFKTEISIHQSKANLDEKILFCNISHLIDPEIKKWWYRACLVTKFPYSIQVHDLPFIEIQVLYLKVAM